nr:hypothetical protein [Crenothrix polyspora]
MQYKISFYLFKKAVMKNLVRCVLMSFLLSATLPVLAESPVVITPSPTPVLQPQNRAVKISIGSVGGKLDVAALRAVRQVVGYGIAGGAVDTFTVYSPKTGYIPIEGGMSACADAGFSASQGKFNAFIQDLKTIKTKAGTFYNVVPALNCPAEDLVACTMEVKICPDGSGVGRSGPFCEFAPCPIPKK